MKKLIANSKAGMTMPPSKKDTPAELRKQRNTDISLYTLLNLYA